MAEVHRSRRRAWRVVVALSTLVAACSTSESETSESETSTTETSAAETTVERPRITALSPTADAVEILTTDDAKAVIEAAEPGAVFEFSPGTHHVDSIKPLDGQGFIGAQGAVISGAETLEDFRPEGDIWVVGGQEAEEPPHGTCARDRPRCNRSEELFVDDEPLEHVDRVDAVIPGTWHFDYEADEVYLGTDPNGSHVELSAARRAFTGDASDVIISGVVVEKFASPA